MIDLTLTPALWFVLVVLAVFRVAWMFTREEGPFAIFGKLRAYLGKDAGTQGLRWTLAELFHCPLCLGVWVSVFAVLLLFLPGVIARVIILWLAVAGLQSFMSLLVLKDE